MTEFIIYADHEDFDNDDVDDNDVTCWIVSE